MHPYSKVSQFFRISEDIFEKSANNFGDSAHRIRRMKVLFRRSAALRQTFQIRHNAKRIRQCSCNFDNKFWTLSGWIELERIYSACTTPIFTTFGKTDGNSLTPKPVKTRRAKKMTGNKGLVRYLVRYLHLFPVNSGNSARSLEIVQSIFDNTA